MLGYRVQTILCGTLFGWLVLIGVLQNLFITILHFFCKSVEYIFSYSRGLNKQDILLPLFFSICDESLLPIKK